MIYHVELGLGIKAGKALRAIYGELVRYYINITQILSHLYAFKLSLALLTLA